MSVSPRRNHPKRSGSGKGNQPERELGQSFEAVEEHDEGVYRVRRITGSSSSKPYRCPGCDQLIPTATPHIVAWIHEDLETRRHWHTPCWERKDRRQPRVQRSRNAPRY